MLYPISPNKPSNTRSLWFKRAIIFAAIVFCIYQFGFKNLINETSHTELLLPGHHIISSYPFFINVIQGEVGIYDTNGFRTIPSIDIPVGYVGVITDKKTKIVNPNPLIPGRYYIDNRIYKVDKVYIEKQTWHFGDDKRKGK